MAGKEKGKVKNLGPEIHEAIIETQYEAITESQPDVEKIFTGRMCLAG
jgi:hypothetical protein